MVSRDKYLAMWAPGQATSLLTLYALGDACHLPITLVRLPDPLNLSCESVMPITRLGSPLLFKLCRKHQMLDLVNNILLMFFNKKFEQSKLSVCN